jgi:hypothetical protein
VPYSSCLTHDKQAIYSIIDSNKTILKTAYYGLTGGVREDAFNFTTTADKLGKYIYNVCISGVTNNIVLGVNYTPTSILTAKIDTSGNLIWQKYFNTSNFYYQPMAICTTADSGIVITGMRYDTLAPSFIKAFEGFVLKYDKNGNQVFVGIPENNKPFADIILFPNPTTNEAYFQINNINNITEVTVSVINTLGETIIRNVKPLTIGQNNLQIDTKSLSAGLYHITITIGNSSLTKKLTVVK